MNPSEVDEIIQCLPRGRTPFYYFRDGYAPMLLTEVLGNGRPVSELKRSPYAPLLQKPALQSSLQAAADGTLRPGHLMSAWPLQPEVFRLSLSRWGTAANRRDTWYQTSRPGENLVLQLNFRSREHGLVQFITKGAEREPFIRYSHPVAPREEEETLAWARLDIDLDAGEALIEEVQNDWLRDAKAIRDYLCDYKRNRRVRRYFRNNFNRKISHKLVIACCDFVIRTYGKLWDEAMLWAAIQFIRHELGIRNIYYHTWDTGNWLKHIEDCPPPRSVYATLPRRFCFTEVEAGPVFLESKYERRFRKERMERRLAWYKMTL